MAIQLPLAPQVSQLCLLITVTNLSLPLALFYALSYPFCVVVLKRARDRRLEKEANEHQLVS